jgi:ferredoxin, 2Fe-2S
MQAALDNSVPGILAECAGSCSCRTCRVQVDAQWAARMTPSSEIEEATLEGHADEAEVRRLSC